MAKKLTLRRLRYADQDTNDVAELVASLASQLNTVPILGGKLLEGVALSQISPNKNIIQHGLGGRPKGAIVVQQSADAEIRVLPASGAEELALTTTVAVTVSLWVF